jgi:hypothetical protein
VLRPAEFRESLHSRRYRILAGAGLVLLVLSAVWWGQGWWPYVLQLVGLALIMLPFPRRPAPQEPDTTSELGPGNWTGAR